MAAEGRIVALLEDSAAEVTPLRHAESVSFALTSPVEQATPDEEGATSGSCRGRCHGLSPPIDEAAHRSRRTLEDDSEERVGDNLLLKRSKNFGPGQESPSQATVGVPGP